jgi:hypothetical protein
MLYRSDFMEYSKLQEKVIPFRSSMVIKNKLLKLAEYNGMSMAAYIRYFISKEYERIFGDDK